METDFLKIEMDWHNPKEISRFYYILKNRMVELNKTKIYEVNWNDEKEITRLYQIFKCRMLEFNKSKVPRKLAKKIIFDCCNKIYNTDISDIYKNIKLDENPIYYAYVHLDTTKRISVLTDKSKVNGRTAFAYSLGMDYLPFYVGKGTGDRCYDTNRNETHRKIKHKIYEYNKEIKIIKIKENITEKEALCIESKLIDIFGLVPYEGYLTNLDEGLLPDLRRELYKNQYDMLNAFNKVNRKVLLEKAYEYKKNNLIKK